MRWLTEALADSPGFVYLLDEASGNPQDSSGNANHCNVVNGTPTYGVAGPFDGMTAISFSGDDQFRAPHQVPFRLNPSHSPRREEVIESVYRGLVQASLNSDPDAA